ncbi:MAG: DUF1330 domain-containing protein [Aquisalinus sp.]|nr:DUF1330 domain-containing protein [Aquisalinus sp.]
MAEGTAKGYWIGHVTVMNADLYKDYVALDTDIVARFGGRFLARGGQCEVPEGESQERHVVIEFPDYATAVACYHSEEYQSAAVIRKANAVSTFVLVEGVAP